MLQRKYHLSPITHFFERIYVNIATIILLEKAFTEI